jgi:hypothetical protein
MILKYFFQNEQWSSFQLIGSGVVAGIVPTATSSHRGGYGRYIFTSLRPALVTE